MPKTEGALRDVELFAPDDTLNGRTRVALIIEDERLSMGKGPANTPGSEVPIGGYVSA